MKYISLFLLLFPSLIFGQGLFPYTDFSSFFKVFDNGYFHQVEYQPVLNVVYGDEIVAYNNAQRDFKVYYKGQARTLTNMNASFKVSDHLVAWNIGPIINYFENGKAHSVTSFGGQYEVSDSLVVYQDTRYNSVNVIYQGKTFPLYQLTGELYMPEMVGDNIVAFRDNGNVYRVFWRGQIYELGVWSGKRIDFFAGTDMLAFNDPINQTFAIFENGQFLDVESLFVSKIKACRGFIVYEDVQGTLRYYGNGERKELATYFQFWDAKDDIIFWGRANSAFTLFKGEEKMVCNYLPKDWKLKNDVIAWRNNLGGVSGYRAGTTKEITPLSSTEYAINGHLVGVVLSNRSVLIWEKDQIYRD